MSELLCFLLEFLNFLHTAVLDGLGSSGVIHYFLEFGIFRFEFILDFGVFTFKSLGGFLDLFLGVSEFRHTGDDGIGRYDTELRSLRPGAERKGHYEGQKNFLNHRFLMVYYFYCYLFFRLEEERRPAPEVRAEGGRKSPGRGSVGIAQLGEDFVADIDTRRSVNDVGRGCTVEDTLIAAFFGEFFDSVVDIVLNGLHKGLALLVKFAFRTEIFIAQF